MFRAKHGRRSSCAGSPIHARRGLPTLVLVACLGAASAAATEPGTPEVVILQPSPIDPISGPVVIEASVWAREGVTEAEAFVDGASLGVRSGPPWRWTADLGSENEEHAFRVVARTAAGRAGESSIRTPRIEVDEELDLDLQQLYVTAVRDGRRVLDLERGSFRVRDDGRTQEIVTFARGDVPLAAALVVDASESMAGERLRAALEGVRTFVRDMQELDEVSVLLFSDQLLASTPFSSHPETVLETLATVEARGKTSVNDHLYLALQQLEERQGRRVVVLFTDGDDLDSALDMEEVLWKARRSRAIVYWIRLHDGRDRLFSSSWRTAEGNRRQRELLGEVVEQSGGRLSELTSTADLPRAFADILAELREQYVLGYYPTGARSDGRWREVDVDVRERGVTLRTRGGYVER